jgi:NADH-quinone oxidoreductase subunit K
MLNISINHILAMTSIVFIIGLVGIALNRTNFLTTIMSMELLLLSMNLNFAAFSVYLDDITGYVFVIVILTIAATESAIGFSILILFYKLKNSIKIKPIKKRLTNKV